MKSNKFLPSGLITFLFPPTLLSSSEVLAQGEPGSRIGPGMYGCPYTMSWFGHITMMVLWIGLLMGIIFLIRWLFVSRQSRREGTRSDDSGLNLLNERYAKGEINKEEFEKIKRDLQA